MYEACMCRGTDWVILKDEAEARSIHFDISTYTHVQAK